jgi:hypothetical protein
MVNDTLFSRRAALKTIAMTSLLAAGASNKFVRSALAASPATRPGWEREPMRWSQVAFTDDDPQHFDPQFWFDHWKRARIDGTCLSAGGVTAYYPTTVPFHTRSPYLGNTDPLGDMINGARRLNL